MSRNTRKAATMPVQAATLLANEPARLTYEPAATGNGAAATVKETATAAPKPTVGKIRITARQSQLLTMLTYKRDSDSQTELDYIRVFIAPTGAAPDGYGNYILEILNADGTRSDIMWSSHTDTVHHKGGTQPIAYGDSWITLADPKVGECLGADCGTGNWLMLQLIKAKKPGVYVFHREEECGGRGSAWISKNTPDLLKGIRFCIALDRKGYDDIITHQGGQRTASDAFAESFAAIVQPAGRVMKGCDGGSFTDSSTYKRQIPECTNIAIGYFNQHGPKESQHMGWACALADAMIKADFSNLVCARDPSKVEYLKSTYEYDNYGYAGYGRSGSRYAVGSYLKYGYDVLHAEADVATFCRRNPGCIADMLDEYGFSLAELEAYGKKRAAAQDEIVARRAAKAKEESAAKRAAFTVVNPANKQSTLTLEERVEAALAGAEADAQRNVAQAVDGAQRRSCATVTPESEAQRERAARDEQRRMDQAAWDRELDRVCGDVDAERKNSVRGATADDMAEENEAYMRQHGFYNH